MINKTGPSHPALDKITRITPTLSLSSAVPMDYVPCTEHPDLARAIGRVAPSSRHVRMSVSGAAAYEYAGGHRAGVISWGRVRQVLPGWAPGGGPVRGWG
jgi:hypothetical protein